MKNVLKRLVLHTSLGQYGNTIVDIDVQELDDLDLDTISGAGFINGFSCENAKCTVTLNKGCTNNNCVTPDPTAPTGP